MKKLFATLGFSIIILSILFYSCKKEKESTQKDLQVDNPTEIKKEFDKHDFSKSLSNRFNDSLTIIWNADWEHMSSKKGGDSAVYYFIPLVPKLGSIAHKSNEYKLHIIGFQQFIIATKQAANEVRFFKAKYIQQLDAPQRGTSTNNRSPEISYAHFTGKLLLDDFSNRGYSINYYQGRAVRKSVVSQNARIVCDQECTWTMECDRGIWVTVTNGRMGDNCPSPDYGGAEAYDCNPGGGGMGGNWMLQSTSLNCYDIPDPIDPSLPTDPSTGGGGGGDNIDYLPTTLPAPIPVADANLLAIPCPDSYNFVKQGNWQSAVITGYYSQFLNRAGNGQLYTLEIGDIETGMPAVTFNGTLIHSSAAQAISAQAATLAEHQVFAVVNAMVIADPSITPSMVRRNPRLLKMFNEIYQEEINKFLRADYDYSDGANPAKVSTTYGSFGLKDQSQYRTFKFRGKDC
ncbi:hypothetical protein [Chitinophaga sp. HK235]|uniref:hypothetical protein n=1 Tax=Chitinophaga sp. HK235 TaxID=2952571 RepID=UPI001BAAE9EE|nr:hypothetical protein [Chitinophaga sp. HK235]